MTFCTEIISFSDDFQEKCQFPFHPSTAPKRPTSRDCFPLSWFCVRYGSFWVWLCQWEKILHNNASCHWLNPYPEWSLCTRPDIGHHCACKCHGAYLTVLVYLGHLAVTWVKSVLWSIWHSGTECKEYFVIYNIIIWYLCFYITKLQSEICMKLDVIA